MHPTDFDLLAEIHGEAVVAGADSLRPHVEECPTCLERRQSLVREESEQRRLLRALDVSVPPIHVDLIRARARARRSRVRIAASIGALVTVASAAVAIPGSPVREWLHRPDRMSRLAPTVPKASISKQSPIVDGVQVLATGSLVIMLGTPQQAGHVRIMRTDLAIATVRAIGGDVGYRVGPGRINLDNRLPAEQYDITIPRSLERFALLAGGRVLLRIDPRHRANALDTLTLDFSRPGGTAP